MKMRTEFIVLVALFGIFLAIGCTDESKTHYVRIQNDSFSPYSITISSGDTVKWTNLDESDHTVVGTDFSSGNITSQGSYEHKFTKAGTYNYYCSIEPSMKGVVIVK